ncbi:MAG: DUF4412 domain-containing protein [Acidobacteriota bacterium]|nr:DUF4412 domain-containing protein [Acidobacteriota bacterium]MDH3524692.1 DUF4412 domain-containing protein [Acidobacteriota bacterium]
MTRRILMALCTTSMLGLPSSAGVVYEIEVKDHGQSPAKTSETEMAAEGRNLKMGIAPGQGDGRGEMIFRGDRREMVVVDHDEQSYVVIDEAAIQQLAGQVSQVADQMAEALKNVPEDQRALVEKMMKQRMPARQAPEAPAADVRRTGERADKNGYPCVKYEVLVEGRRIRELWVTDWGNVEGGDEARDAFREMAEFFSEMLDAFSDAAGGLGGFGAQDGGIFADMKEIDGFPVVTSGFGGDGSLEDESALRSARRQAIDPAEFEPPAGYKRRSMLGQ